MADLKKRITSLTEKTTLTSGDFAAVDNTSGGTKKFNLYQLTQSVADKADADGSYEGMTAGNAEQLLSDVYTEDSEPYKCRASFSGDREFDEIVGGTVAWNQLCNGTSVTVTNGHKYYMVKGGTKSIGASTGSAITGLTSGTDIVIDLTQLFGSTIADYIYAQEQATAGAGVAIFRKLFPASYYAYNVGELISVSSLSAHETVGKNMLPAPVDATKTSNGITITAKNGVYKITGTATGTAEIIFNLPFEVEINPTVKTAFLNDAINAGVVVYYRYNNTNLWSMGMGGNTNRVATYTTTSAVNRLRFLISSGTQIAGMMTLSPMLLFSAIPNPTEFESYQKHSYPLDSSLTLRGIPKLSNGKMYFDGDTYASDGTVTRRYGVRAYQSGDTTDGSTMITDGTNTVYKLSTATTETAEPFTNPQIVSEYGTEEYVSTTICPVGHNTKYPENLRKKIEGLPWDLSMIAPIENGTTASKAYSVGQYFLHNDVFCKAKTSIASGATFTLNTNYTETTVAAELYSALH